MTIWTPNLEGRDGPTYRAIADALAEAIADGTLGAGARLPTHRDLAWSLGVTVTTVTRSYQEARRRGLIDGEVGRGTFVRSQAEVDVPGPGGVKRFNLPPLIERADGGEPVNLSLNFPPLMGQQVEFGETLGEIGRSNILGDLLGYQEALGNPEHRAAAARWLTRFGVPATGESVVLTAGAQHAMQCSMMALCRPGDTVLTEPLTYPGMKALAGQLDLRLVPVEADADGMRPDAFEEAIRLHAPRAVYTMPTLHNPITTVMPEGRRRALARIAEAHALPVVEDDVYGVLLPDHERPPPLTSMMPRHGLYLSGCSKSMAPGMRLGMLHAPAEYVQRLGLAVRSSCWMAPPLMAEVMRRWVDGGQADAMGHRLRAVVGERRALADSLLAPVLTAPAYTGGRGGDVVDTGHRRSFHLWLPLPSHWHTESFVDKVHRMGAIILPAETFAVGRKRPVPGVRVCLGAVNALGDLHDGLSALARALTTGPESVAAIV